MTSPIRRYLAYGLRIDSEVPLPFAPSSPPDASAPDVTVRFGRTPSELGAKATRGREWQANPGTFLMNMRDIGRYLAVGGREVTVQPTGGSRLELGRHLAGSPMGVLLQQRRLITLHAAAIATDAGAVLFAGRAGMGKSSLVGALAQRGYPMLTDGFTAVAWEADRTTAHGRRLIALPGLPGLRLHPDTLAELNCWPHVQGRVRANAGKYLLPMARYQATPLAVRAIYVLTARDQAETATEQLSAGDAFGSLRNHTYRRRVLYGSGQQLAHFRAISAIARELPVHRLWRPERPFLLHGLAAHVDADLRQPASRPVVPPTAGA